MMNADFRRRLAVLLVLVAALLMATVPAEAAQKEADGNPEATESAEAAQNGADGNPEATVPAAVEGGTDADSTAPSPAPGYVLVTTATQSGWLPLPEEGEVSLPIRQTLPDGTECENIVHLSPTGVYMENSTCENHDCMGQGEVTLDNRKDRILGNMIICLPNQVVLELYTPEELLEMMKSGQQSAD